MAAPWESLLRWVPAIPLYLFLGVLLLSLWKEREWARMPGDLVPAACLRHQTEGAATTYPLQETNLLGRAADNTIRLTDKAVSAYHARLSYQGGQWWLEDLGSRNGTMVNRFRVESPLVITFGDLIQLGEVALVLAPGTPSSQGLPNP